MFMMKHVKTEFEIVIMGMPFTLPATQLAEGCVGVALVFDTRENAGKYDASKELIEVKEVPALIIATKPGRTRKKAVK